MKKRKFIDLTDPIADTPPDEMNQTKIKYTTHKETLNTYGKIFGLTASDLPDGLFAAVEMVTAHSHMGTHMDAPYHWGPISGGKPAKRIDEIPLEWCFGDGVVLDFSHRKRGDLITGEDIQEALRKINYKIKPFDIVLIRTDTSKHFGEPGWEYMNPGMGRDSTLWLINQGVKVMGIDAWGWDRPFDVMVDEYKKTGVNRIWAGHFVGREKEYAQLERLANLDQIPRPYGFTVSVFPTKISRAGAGWVRAVAIVEE